MRESIAQLVRRWFGLSTPVGPRFYALSGASLMAAKYAIDALAVWAVARQFWTPVDYLNPVYALRNRALGAVPDWFVATMFLWTLPFLWVGVSMSVRRAADAGRSAWAGLWFLVPFANYATMLYLAFAPRKPVGDSPVLPGSNGAPGASGVDDRLASALLGVASGAAVAIGMTAFSVYVLRSYGQSLFMGTPVIVGITSGYLYNRRARSSIAKTTALAASAICVASLAMLLFAVEGIVCLAMVFPLACGAAALGSLLGRALAGHAGATSARLVLLVLCLPALAGVERMRSRAPVPHRVLSTIDIDAPPERIWPLLTAFSAIEPPTGWLFATGIAYPVRARTEGRGVGAIRRCEFSTGAFVEPITVWDEPRRLAFDVSEQPAPMKEWSVYRRIHPPHLDGYFRSRRGEFRLIPLASNRTRIEGSTWYELEIAPEPYFASFADAIIHAIHDRVLGHLKLLAEGDRERLAAGAAPTCAKGAMGCDDPDSCKSRYREVSQTRPGTSRHRLSASSSRCVLLSHSRPFTARSALTRVKSPDCDRLHGNSLLRCTVPAHALPAQDHSAEHRSTHLATSHRAGRVHALRSSSRGAGRDGMGRLPLA